jgi:DNA-binding XRE family transcriptional regulator
MKKYTLNDIFSDLFFKENCTQIEFGHKIDLNKHSVHDWLKHKNQMKFNKLEEVAEKLGKRVIIKIEDI